MIEEVGTVTASGSGEVEIELAVKSTCSSCQVSDSCGTSTIAKAFSHKTETLTIATELEIPVGHRVRIGVPEQWVLSLSLAVYIVPLLVLLVSVVVGDSWLMPLLGLDSEMWNIALAFFLTWGSFSLVKNHLRTHPASQCEPVILAVLNDKGIPIRNLS